MKVVLLGNNSAARHVLDILLAHGVDLMVVVPFQKKVHSWHESLYDHAIERGIKALYDPENINSPIFIDEIKKFSPDLIVSVYYDQILRKEIISLPSKASINIHPSLLPRYAGTAPLIWAIINNEDKTGITIHHIDSGIDSGNIIMQDEVEITREDTGYSLHLKAAEKVKELFSRFMDDYDRLLASARPQEGTRTYYSKSTPSKNEINWSDSAEQIYNIVRALTKPLPGAYTYFLGERCYIWKCGPVELTGPDADTDPAQVPVGHPFCSKDMRSLYVRTGQGLLKIDEMKIGGIELTGEQFIKRYPGCLHPGFEMDKTSPTLDTDTVAIEGGSPVRDSFLYFGVPALGKEEMDEVAATMKSGWIGKGNKTARFEKEFAEYVGCGHAVSLNSCTAGLFLSLLLGGVKPGDEVITTPMTFAATVNVIEHCGARPVFVDIEPDTLNINAGKIEAAITPKTKVIMPVHFGGLACNMDEINKIAERHKLTVVEDAAHAIGARYKGTLVGGSGNPTCFSFYANKNITTAEGGMVATNDEGLAYKLRLYSLHGLDHDAWRRYRSKELIMSETIYPGYKFNMTDMQASMGIHQLKKVEGFLEKREQLAYAYDSHFKGMDEVELQYRPADLKTNRHALHLYVILLRLDKLSVSRNQVVEALREENLGVGIHYIAAHMHKFYRDKYGYKPDDFPVSHDVSNRTITLPLSPGMSMDDLSDTVAGVKKVINYYKK